jgi:hypothetical protein
MSETVDTKRPEDPAGRERGASWGFIAGLVLLALVMLLVRARLEPPAPKGTDAPATEFSGERAFEVLSGLSDGHPHPMGSPGNDRVRERLLADLRQLGYSPEVQDGFLCSPSDTCGRARNVTARLDGTSPGKALLLMAHYDSVHAGPGIGDDLSGVAALLEVARALKAGPPLRNPVLFLFTDGEEAGLMGAELFANRHPAARDVGAVVNLEARGTAGPSLMFETIGENAWLVRAYAGAAPHPITSSVYATIYELMPNDTDLTIFRHRGYHGLNFAFVQSPNYYHTSSDSLEHLSRASLQHHGDNALAAARALGQVDLASPPHGDAVFFDVLGLGVARWPMGAMHVIAILALVLVAVAVVLASRRGELPPRGLLFGLLAFLGAVVLAGLLAFALGMVLRGASPYAWVSDPQPDLAAFWFLALAVVTFLAAALSRRAGAAGLWSGIWIGWSVLGLIVSLYVPGIGYLFVVPALVAGIAGLVSGPRAILSSLLPALVAALLFLPILLPLYDGLGQAALHVIAILAAVLFTTLAPLVPGAGALGRRWVPLAALVLVLVSVGLAFASAPYSKGAPAPLTFELFQQADTGEARWLARGARPLAPAVRQAAQFSADREPSYPWSQSRSFVAPAPRLDAPGPQLAVLEDSAAGGKRHLRLLLTSERKAPWAAVVIPESAKLESIKVDGQEVPPPRRKLQRVAGDPREISVLTLPPDGAEIEVVLGETRPQDWYVWDYTSGLPPAGAALVRARPEIAVPMQSGDGVEISRKVRI